MVQLQSIIVPQGTIIPETGSKNKKNRAIILINASLHTFRGGAWTQKKQSDKALFSYSLSP